MELPSQRNEAASWRHTTETVVLRGDVNCSLLLGVFSFFFLSVESLC